jgi:hypothetical protein
MKTQEDYRAVWDDLYEECSSLEGQRDNLETELSEVKGRIAHLQAVMNHLRPLAGVPLGDDISGLGITDAIRAILENAKERMTPQDVRRALANKGFDLSGYSAPMSSIYKILARLADDQSSPVFRIRDGSGVSYEWRTPMDISQQAEISDDDIPF